MKLLAIDPGIRNCGFVVLSSNELTATPALTRWGGWFDYDTDDTFHRALRICRTLIDLQNEQNCNYFVTERFFSQGALADRRAAANYGRGVLDGLLQLSMGSYFQCTIHPTHLKMVFAGKGNAKKEIIGAALTEYVQAYWPDWLARIKEKPAKHQEHLIEALGLGLIGYWKFNDQHETMADLEPAIAKRLRIIAQPWIPPTLSKVSLPTTHWQAD